MTNSTGNGFLDDLLNFIEEQEVKELGLDVANETYVINNNNDANYFAKKLREIRDCIQEINNNADNQLASYSQKVEHWREKSIKPLTDSETYCLKLLKEFAERQLAGSNRKSIKLIEGTLQFRSQQAKFEYDDDALLAYLQTNLPDYVKQKPQIEKAELKKAGEIKNGKLFVVGQEIPGIVISPQETTFDVK